MAVSSGQAPGEEPRAQRPHMPRFHLRPQRNWINDPVGFTKVGDRYHVFFQYNPLGSEPGIKHWGHAVSRDLVDWEILPIALSPTEGGPDEGGCWSGSITTLVEPAHLFYTGVRHDPMRGRSEVVCLALGDPDLQSWRKHPDVLIPGPPVELDTVGFRDPFIWHDGDAWCLLVGSGIRGYGGAILLYRSEDLLSWRYDGVFFSVASMQSHHEMGAMWECPQLVPLEDRYVLLLSIDNPVRPVLYVVGHVDGSRFVAERIGRLDLGPDFFAPTTLVDDDSRPLIIAWAPEGRSSDAQIAAGWAGVMTQPRALTHGPGGGLYTAPARELVMLRRTHWQGVGIALPNGVDVPMPLAGSRLEIAVLVRAGGASLVGLRFRMSPDGHEATVVSVDIATGRLTFDRTASSLAPDSTPGVYGGVAEWAPGERFRLHLFVDESIVELFVDDTLALTGRIYPTRADSIGIAAFAVGGAAEIEAIDIWQLTDGGTVDPRRTDPT
jgi:beta-fructofuranosidase